MRLRINVLRNGQHARTEYVEDPRIAMVRVFNSTSPDEKMVIPKEANASRDQERRWMIFTHIIIAVLAALIAWFAKPEQTKTIITPAQPVFIEPVVNQDYLQTIAQKLTQLRIATGWNYLPKDRLHDSEAHRILVLFKKINWMLERPGTPTPEQWDTEQVRIEGALDER